MKLEHKERCMKINYSPIRLRGTDSLLSDVAYQFYEKDISDVWWEIRQKVDAAVTAYWEVSQETL